MAIQNRPSQIGLGYTRNPPTPIAKDKWSHRSKRTWEQKDSLQDIGRKARPV